MAGAWPRMRRAFLLLLLIVQAFVPRGTTMPSADFCRTVRADRSALSPDSGTCGRPPEVSSTAFNAQPPNLQPVPLMDMDFAVTWPARPAQHASCPVFVHRLASLLHASFRPRLATTPLRFAITSPPSGSEGDFHPQAVKHARRTNRTARELRWPFFLQSGPHKPAYSARMSWVRIPLLLPVL